MTRENLYTAAERAALAGLVAVLVGCTHLEHHEREYNAQGGLSWEWKTEASTFIGLKAVEYVIDQRSEAAQLAGNGMSERFAAVAMRAIEISPVFAERLVAALRPGGQLEGALAEIAARDPDLAEVLEAAAERVAAREAAADLEPEGGP